MGGLRFHRLNGGWVSAVCREGVALALIVSLAGATSAPAFPKASKTPDPVAAKKQVEKLGVGEHVAVKRVAATTLHGHITNIGEESFKLRADNATQDTEIPYNQVLHVRKNPGPLTWMFLGALLVIVVIIAATR